MEVRVEFAPVETLRHKARVIEELGEKVVEALVGAVDAARDDLRRYRVVRSRVSDMVEEAQHRHQS